MEKKADLHIHTFYSDGTFSPQEVLNTAKAKNLAAIAICDHDCTDGIYEAQDHSKEYGVEVVPGVEITSEKDGIEIHILGYFIDIEAKPLLDMLRKLRESRVNRIYNMVDKLKEHNVNISPEAVFELSDKGSIGRPHLAQALYNEGLVPSVREAFERYLGDHAPCYVRRFNLDPEGSIKVILRSGGVPVFAHPKVMGRDDFIPSFLKAGLRGLEVYHTDQSGSASEHYAGLATKYGLIMTGGSDCHGRGKSKILMGGVTVPYATVELLKQESRDIRRSL